MESSIGERIRFRRKELKLTQLQIKEETGISSGNLSDIENGNKLPSTPALISLSKILDCSIDWILTGKSYNSDSLLCENELHLLKSFRELPKPDQEEILEIVIMKQNRIKRELSREKSYHSTNQTNDAKMA